MATRDHFAPNDRFPLFLSNQAREAEQRSIGKAWNAVISSPTVNMVVLVFTAAAIVFAIVTVGTPIVLFAKIAGPQASMPPPEHDIGRAIPAFQSTANAQASLPSAPQDELLRAFEAAFEGKTEVEQPRAEALLSQFQGWAAEASARLSRSPPQPLKDARAQVLKKARAVPSPKPRPVQTEQTAAALGPVEDAQWPAGRFGWRY